MMKILALLFLISFAGFCGPRNYVPIPLDPNDPFEAPLRGGGIRYEQAAETREHILRIVGPSPSLDAVEQALVVRGANCARSRRQLHCTHIKIQRTVQYSSINDTYFRFDVMGESTGRLTELAVCVRWWGGSEKESHPFNLKCAPETAKARIK